MDKTLSWVFLLVKKVCENSTFLEGARILPSKEDSLTKADTALWGTRACYNDLHKLNNHLGYFLKILPNAKRTQKPEGWDNNKFLKYGIKTILMLFMYCK